MRRIEPARFEDAIRFRRVVGFGVGVWAIHLFDEIAHEIGVITDFVNDPTAGVAEGTMRVTIGKQRIGRFLGSAVALVYCASEVFRRFHLRDQRLWDRQEGRRRW